MQGDTNKRQIGNKERQIKEYYTQLEINRGQKETKKKQRETEKESEETINSKTSEGAARRQIINKTRQEETKGDK